MVSVCYQKGSVFFKANSILFEEKWVITGNARSSICFKYVDDPFTKFGSNDNFTIEIEKSTKFPFVNSRNSYVDYANTISRCMYVEF